MIVLKNINKLYNTKENRKVLALKNINISFPSKGLCLIYGKSGSGKTTLLNILGGLDNKYDGEFYVCNKRLIGDNEFSNYRKNYASFIFQNFNLIDDLTVEENLLLGYKFSSNKSLKKVSEVLNIIGLKDYEKRYPSELSGGEQQRIVIGRALLKDSKILLADEPTGNLDNENSEEIFNLLKEISKEKLVILVSHNLDLGLKYADYIVKLNNGEIESNNIEVMSSEEINYNDSNNKVISNKTAIKLGIHELSYKKVRTFMTIFLMILCFSVLAFTVSIFQYNHCDPHYHLIKSQNYEYFKITNVNYKIQQEITEKNVENIVINNTAIGCLNFMSKQEVEEKGFKFYESSKTLELSPDVYYISDAYLKQLFYANCRAIIDGENVRLNFEDYKLIDVIGGKIELFGYDRVCGGVYYSPFSATNNMYIQNDEFDMLKHYENELYSTYIQHSLFFEGKSRNNEIDISVDFSNKSISFGDKLETSVYTNVILLDSNGNIEVCENLNDNIIGNNEMYVSLSTYNKIFNTYYKNEYLINVEKKDGNINYLCNHIPEELGKVVSIKVKDEKNNEVIALENMKIKGIVFTEIQLLHNVNSEAQFIALNQENAFKFKKMTKKYDIWVKTNTIEDLSYFLKDLYLNYDIDFYTPITDYILDFENALSTLKLSMILVCITLIIIVIAMVSLLLSSQVLNRKKEIGIFKALGTQNIDIVKIYLYEILFISIPVIIFSILFSIVTVSSMNKAFVANSNPQFVFIYYKYSNIPISILLIFSCIFFAIILPLIKIIKLNVIGAIRNNK